MVVLIEYVVSYWVPLGFEEVPGPQDLWHYIAGADQLRFGGTLGVQLLSGGHAIYGAFSKGHVATRVTPHVRVDGVGTVDPPFDHSQIICL